MSIRDATEDAFSHHHSLIRYLHGHTAGPQECDTSRQRAATMPHMRGYERKLRAEGGLRERGAPPRKQVPQPMPPPQRNSQRPQLLEERSIDEIRGRLASRLGCPNAAFVCPLAGAAPLAGATPSAPSAPHDARRRCTPRPNPLVTPGRNSPRRTAKLSTPPLPLPFRLRRRLPVTGAFYRLEYDTLFIVSNPRIYIR